MTLRDDALKALQRLWADGENIVGSLGAMEATRLDHQTIRKALELLPTDEEINSLRIVTRGELYDADVANWRALNEWLDRLGVPR